jgi:phosphatidylserine/phosphatidylglycerophosphate/cardiolipin synthase-like enzyme
MEIDQPVRKTRFLDAVVNELKAVSPGLEGTVWERTGNNMLDAPEDDPSWLLQVPDLWGWSPKNGPIPDGTVLHPGIKRLLAKVTGNISQAKKFVDISGWGIPGIYFSPVGPYPDGKFLQAIADGLAQAADIAAHSGTGPLKVRVLSGVPTMMGHVSPADFRDLLKSMVGHNANLIDLSVAVMLTRSPGSQNHTKLLVVDGISVIHGGINWMSNYYIEDGGTVEHGGHGGVAPVTDLDIALRGPAAASAVKFLDVLWDWAWKNASLKVQDAEVFVATSNEKDTEISKGLYAKCEPPPEHNGLLDVISVASLGYGIAKRDPASEYHPPDAQNVDQAARTWWVPFSYKSNNETNIDIDFMTVNPDANALRVLIENAQSKIVLSQQDINGFSHFPMYHALFDVRLVDAIAAKITAEVPVPVRIVLSNPGYPDYSNISSIDQAAAALFARVRLKTKTDADAVAALKAGLHLATLRVSEEPTWPKDRKYRLHTKVICVDDIAFYVGSRNAYPDTTQDHGFIIEDAAAARQLNEAFLDKQWAYSRAAIYDWEVAFAKGRLKLE